MADYDEQSATEAHQEMADELFTLLMDNVPKMSLDELIAVTAQTLGYFVLAASGNDVANIRREELNKHVVTNLNIRIDEPDPRFGQPETPLN